MATRSLGALTIDLVARIGGFERGLSEAERKSDRTAREIARKQKQLAKELDAAAKGIGIAFGAAAAGLGVAFAALDRQIKGAAAFKDLEETTGASAEGLASMAVAAETAGVSLDAIAANSIRLTKGLTGVDDESKAAGAAIKALGLNIEDFKKLDPIAQFDALTKAFANFKDGPEKAAAATAIFGKSGAEMLKVFKALEEQGGRTKLLTQEQIELADAYADAQAKSAAELKLYTQVAATEAAPAFLALSDAATEFIKELIGIDKETGKLAQSTAVKDFADGAVQAIAFVVDAGDGVVRVFKGIGLTIGAVGAAVVAVASGEFKQAKTIIGELLTDLDAVASRTLFSDNLRARLGQSAPAKQKSNLPELPFNGAVKGAKAAKQEIDQAAKALADLEEELALLGQDESFVKAFKFEGLTNNAAAIERYRDTLAQLDHQKAAAAIEEMVKALEQEAAAIGLTTDELKIHELVMKGATAADIQRAKSALDAADAVRKHKEAEEEIKRIYEETRTPLEKYEATLKRLNELRSQGLDDNTYLRSLFKAQEEFDTATKKTEEKVDDFTKRFAQNTQDFLGQGFYDVLQGNFQDAGDAFAKMIQRMVAEAAAADLAKYLFGDLVSGGSGSGVLGGLFGGSSSGSGLFSSIASLFGGFFADGGNPPLGKVSVVGEEGPELFVPKQAGTIVPLTKVEPSRPSERPIQQTLIQQFAPGTNRQTIDQAAVAAGRALQRATSRGTV